MEKPLKVYNNVAAFKEWPTNFKLLFQALQSMRYASSNILYMVYCSMKHLCVKLLNSQLVLVYNNSLEYTQDLIHNFKGKMHQWCAVTYNYGT